MAKDDAGHVIFKENGETKITVDCRTDEVIFAEGLSPSEAALFFWTHVGKLAKQSWDENDALKLEKHQRNLTTS